MKLNKYEYKDMQRRFFIKAVLLLTASSQAMSKGIVNVLEGTKSNFKSLVSDKKILKK
jgi:hypothetical protein